MTPADALQYAIAKVGAAKLSQEIGVTRQAISQWDECPVLRVLKVEELSGVPRWELRPDVYPAPARPAPAEGATV